ncbi:MAG: TldD/PmbA family protein [Thermoproteota archaeon]|nr:TldD/PmbA family protein [Thermoproteota archaeon]
MSEANSIKKILNEEKVDEWDIYIEKSEENEIQLRNFNVEIVRGPVTNFGYAVRTIKRKKDKTGIGIGTGSSLEPTPIRRCLKTALIGANITEFPGYAMPKPKKYPSVKIADPKIVSNAESVVKDKVEELLSLLKESKTILPTFGKIRTYNISTIINNSEGVEAEKQETFFYVELALKAGQKGKLAEYWPTIFVRRAEDIPLNQQVPKWIRLAEDALQAKVPKTMKTTVIFTPHVLSDILPNTIGFHSLGSSVYKELSRFKKGKKIGSRELTIYDDGLYNYALGSSPFDDEGAPQSKTTLIEKGVYKDFLYDMMYATIMNAKSTGNGQKLPPIGLALSQVDLKYSSLPSSQPTNIVVEAGNMSLDEMIADTKEGIYVEQFSAMGSDSFTTSFGSEIRNAYLIEKGELSTPLKGGQISGFVLDSQNIKGEKINGLLSQISAVTKKTEIANRCVTPYMRFDEVQVAGK